MARKIERIIIHCSDSPNGRSLFTGKLGDKNFTTPLQEIDNWHRERGFKRLTQWRERQEPQLTSIGYHFLIYTAGAVAGARHVDEIGAHAQGYNATSIGICLIGKDLFTQAQWDALREQVKTLQARHPGAQVVGHRDLPGVSKTCPNFDVSTWFVNDMQPTPDRIFN
ncbi:MAG: N-acetylmuramoyl-L-alanine amidase [Gallionella sp.]|nr:N-acetylmuramoyl-L-alanine amidase [Gallionella sp.]MDD4946456.1 N-acetylmuramoyl-L-alanine amidase [Gallionella sp.]